MLLNLMLPTLIIISNILLDIDVVVRDAISELLSVTGFRFFHASPELQQRQSRSHTVF